MSELPHDVLAEQCAIGAALLDPSAATLAQVMEIAPPEDFYRPAHTVILTAMRELADQGKPCDAIAVNAALTRRGEITQVGGAAYLHTLTEAVPAVANGAYYARIVAQRALLRKLVLAGTRITQLGYAPGEADVDALVEQARDTLHQLSPNGSARDPDVQTLVEGFPGFVDELEHGIDTGTLLPVPYVDLAAKLTGGGLQPGHLITLGGRPGHGKTTIALDLMRHVAKAGHRVLFFSLEMTHRELQAKLLAAEAELPTTVAMPTTRPAALTEAQWARARAYSARVGAMDITIDEKSDCGLARVKARVAAMRRAGQLPHLVVVDYLQLMETNTNAERRDLQIAELTRGLKNLAKDHNLVVLLLAQLRREAAERRGGMPLLSDFRESSSIEQDSNVALLINTPHVDDPDDERAGTTILKVAKNRGGPLGEIHLAAQFHYSRCHNLATA